MTSDCTSCGQNVKKIFGGARPRVPHLKIEHPPPHNIGFWTNTSTTSRQKYIIQDIMTMTCTVTLSLHNSYKLVLILSKYGHLCINRDQGIALPGKTIEW